MYQEALLSQDTEKVKSIIVSEFSSRLDNIFNMAKAKEKQRKLEEEIWAGVLSDARSIMGTALSFQCRISTEADMERRGIEEGQFKYRNEKDYWITLTTTFGPVCFFSFAYRDLSRVLPVTRTPAREEVFGLHKHCRSSELCLEWEARLGSEMPYRHAQKALTYFSHGAVKMEDTTIASHIMTMSHLIERDWLYQEPVKIREILEHCATRDLETGKPIIYLSTDAHALRRYVDETWDAAWKMANGLRLWCVDRHNGAIIHIGGEFTWGDCHRVGKIMDWLIETGHVPIDGNYGEGLIASVCIVADGMPWIEDYVVSKFDSPVAILDAYHVMEHLQDYANTRFGKGSKKAKKYYNEYLRSLFGERLEKLPKQKRRKRAVCSKDETNESKNIEEQKTPLRLLSLTSDDSTKEIDLLIQQIKQEEVEVYHEDDRDKLVGYLEHNAYRMNYRNYKACGYQIGSGAMESFHRTGSQKRLKIPGARWLSETSQALFNFRMLYLCGRWEEFWHQPSLYHRLIEVFSNKPSGTENDSLEVIDEAA